MKLTDERVFVTTVKSRERQIKGFLFIFLFSFFNGDIFQLNIRHGGFSSHFEVAFGRKEAIVSCFLKTFLSEDSVSVYFENREENENWSS